MVCNKLSLVSPLLLVVEVRHQDAAAVNCCWCSGKWGVCFTRCLRPRITHRSTAHQCVCSGFTLMIAAETKLGFAYWCYCGLSQKNTQPPTRQHQTAVFVAVRSRVCIVVCVWCVLWKVLCGGAKQGPLVFRCPRCPRLHQRMHAAI